MMIRITRLAVVTLAIACVSAATSARASLAEDEAAGNWRFVIQTAQVQLEILASLEQDDDDVRGTIAAPTGPVPAAGTMIDNELKLEFVLHLPEGDVSVTMTGELGPDGLTGRATLGRLGDGDWTGTRVE